MQAIKVTRNIKEPLATRLTRQLLLKTLKEINYMKVTKAKMYTMQLAI